jgi:hypothetical protein
MKVYRRDMAANSAEEKFLGWMSKPSLLGFGLARFPDGTWESNIDFTTLQKLAKVIVSSRRDSVPDDDKS